MASTGPMVSGRAVLTQAQNGATEIVLRNVVWTADGQLQTLEYGNGLTETRNYGQDGYLAQITVTGSNGTSLSRTYTRDAAGRITQIADGTLSRSETYGYDNADRLTSASGPYGTRTYAYDGVGNRLTQDEDGNASAYVYGSASNRLMTITGADAASLDYDAAGNTTAKDNVAFQYNAANRLDKITLPGSPATTLDFAYNALGERIGKTTAADTTYFHYNRQGLLVAETNASGDPIREYLWLGDVSVGFVATRVSGSEPELFFVQTDHVAATLEITDGNQEIAWQAAREPFGQVYTVGTNAIVWPLRFPGQYEDGETGLFYNYFRNYDPAVGRYIESDPMGMFDGPNSYSYAHENPLSFYDPDGRYARGGGGLRYDPDCVEVGHEPRSERKYGASTRKETSEYFFGTFTGKVPLKKKVWKLEAGATVTQQSAI